MSTRAENWVGEYTSTIGIGDIILGGPIDGFCAFSNVGSNVTVYYTVMDGSNKETGSGTLVGNTLVRSDIHAVLVDGIYTKGGSPLVLSGDAQVYLTANASFVDYVQQIDASLTQAITALDALADVTINGNHLSGAIQLNADDVGLGNVDNTSDVNKPVSAAQQSALNLKANLESPALTGTPSAPTAAAGTNTAQIATTAFVSAEISNNESKIFEALRRSYADAGFNLVEGSFEEGGVLSVASDVMITASGDGYSWAGAFPKVVVPGTDPTLPGSGYVPRTDVTLRGELTSGGSTIADIAGQKSVLASSAGATVIGSTSGKTVQQELDAAKSRLVNSSIRAPSLPTLGAEVKMIIKPAIIADAKCLVVTRKAQGKAGYVAIALTDVVSPSDSQNTGGASNIRPGYVLNLANAWIARTIYSAKSAGSVLSTLTSSQINVIWGYTLAGDEYYAETATAAVSWLNRQVYSLNGNADYITYAVSGKSCKLVFGMTNGSSAAADIMVSGNGTDFYLHSTVTTKQPPSGTVSRREVTVETGLTGTWYVKVVNKTAASEPCYVAGVNIMPLSEAKPDTTYDNAMISAYAAVNSVPNQYLGGTGANEFAAKDLTTGKFFGTYHGGHSGFLQRLRTDGASYNLDSGSAPTLLLTRGVQLHSVSTLTTGASVYSYVAETSIGDGVTITSYSLQLQSGGAALCERAYTHMCTTMRDFNYIHLPKYQFKTDDGDVPVGQCQFIQQARSYDAAQLNCYFSGVDTTENSNGGAYVSFQPNYNKQYYGPALNSAGYEFTGGQFVTAKEFF